MVYDLIIRNATLRDDALPLDIGIKDGEIKTIGEVKEKASANKEVDAKGCLVIPGFVNSHTHLDKADLISQMKPSQFGGSLEENRRLIREFKEDYTIASIRRRARKVIKELVGQGITAIRTQVDVDLTAKLTPLKALFALKEEFVDFVHIQICAFPQEGVFDSGARDLLEQALNEGADLLGGLPLVEGTRRDQEKHIDMLFEIAKRHNKDLDIQIDESNNLEDFLLPYLVEKTIGENYCGRVTATHCISLSKVKDEIADRIMERLKQAEINVIITPSCNLITRFPNSKRSRPYNSITRAKELLEKGVNVALGTDNIRDIFYPLGNGSMIREMHILATTTRMSGIEDVQNLFDMASLNGARLMGLNYGMSLGKQADLLITNSTTKRGTISDQEIIPYIIKNGRVIIRREVSTTGELYAR
ncbi:MAG: amidohydrolase family protein [Thermodesulfobacteriota bacterium]|nr:amidohydrolase family protein [Thermodesulfobacteriota bacterium]